ncbi:polymorphic toxin-type HINT domain-containing protein [Paenibacillus sp. J22TS3]|uniref:polymorphic toxin-type HINT domain-containing protein n=1 Tax=Paenibacillus sp. J22TS3 TaxID=2807192 RepID=UPI001B2BD4CC|nr:polymorphic toxin-type HINT domain-containing protein [Paenibacillus sp. J22TS3]GIP20642.1 hypothetical protein J22TS3_09170 [Paenibacillus sp. J22TS3]
MLKRILVTILCLSITFTGLGTIANAATDGQQALSSNGNRKEEIVTLSRILEKFHKEESWLDQQLAEGYSLYQIYTALDQSGGDLSAYKTIISKNGTKTNDPQVQVNKLETSSALLLNRPSSLAAQADYDQAAVDHLPVDQPLSPYVESYGSDSVSVATGDLTVGYTDFTLPGSIPFSLNRVYDSSKANNDISVKLSGNIYKNEAGTRREEADSQLGRGWRWDQPYIMTRDSRRFLYFPGIGTYRILSDLTLQGYKYKNLKLADDTSAVVNGRTSKYKLAVLNGPNYYFDDAGYLILIQDDYNNRVEFSYTKQGIGNVLTKVKNSDGNELAFTYTDTQVTVKQTGTELVKVYTHVMDEDRPVLTKVTDALGKDTKYFYRLPEARFNFLASLVGQLDQQSWDNSALLTRIVSPTSSITDFDYAPSLKTIGSYATRFVFKTTKRQDAYAALNGDVIVHKRSFNYTNEDLTSFGKDAKWVTTIEGPHAKQTFQLRKLFDGATQPDIHFLDEYRTEGDQAASVEKLTYDSSKRNIPIKVEDYYIQNGKSSEPVTGKYKYDENGLILSLKQSTGQETTYDYQKSAEPYFWNQPSTVKTKIADNQFRVETNAYDSLGGLKQSSISETGSVNKLLSQTNYQYDSYGNPVVVEVKDDSRTISTRQFYESPYGHHLVTKESTQVTGIDNSSSTVSRQYEYFPTGALSLDVDEAGNKTSYQYDKTGRIVLTGYSDGSSEKVVYDDNLNTVTSTDPSGLVTIKKYNPVGFLAQEVQDDAVFQYFYDTEGNTEEYIDAEGNKTSYKYDSLDRLVQTNYADGSKDLVDYDLINRTTTNTDASGYKMKETYDLLGQTVSIEEFNNETNTVLEKRGYNLVGDVISVTDGKNQQTIYGYDGLGRTISVTDPKQQTTKYTYSLSGNLTKIQLPDRSEINKQYDELGREILHINQGNQSRKYYYDTRGNITKFVDFSGKTKEYQYDSDNHLTQIKAPETTINYTYDFSGRRTTMQDAQGTTRYTYDPTDGSLTTLTYPDGTKIEYSYNTQVRTGYTLVSPNGSATQIQGNLDELNRVKDLEVSSKSGAAAALAATPGDKISFEYGSNKLLKRQTTVSGTGIVYSYKGYDLSGVSVEQGGNQKQQFNYQYDNNKNIISRTQNQITDSFAYDPLNRIQKESTTESTRTYSYDNKGNRINVEGSKIAGMQNAEFTFDSLDRLTGVKGEGKEVSYRYNGDDLLYERKEKDKLIRYYYDEEAKLIAEAEVKPDGSPKLLYVYVYDLGGQLWARKDKNTGAMQYYQFNGHGDVIGLTDSKGTELNSYAYDVWGHPENTKETVPNIFRYSGEYWDETTGLQYLRARWYDPGMGRFIAEDTYEGDVTNPLSLNLYTYVENNPLISVDPTGHWCTSADGRNAHPGQCSSNDPEKYYMDDYQIPKGMPYLVNGRYLGEYRYDNGLKFTSDPQGNRQYNFWNMFPKDVYYYDYVMSKPLSSTTWTAVSVNVTAIFKKFVANVVSKTKSKTKTNSCNCFVAGTKIKTDEGEKNIEDIEVGDKVLSKDEETGKQAYKEVTHLYRNDKEIIYELTVGDQVIETTDNHPFWVEGKGWVLAADLQVGDKLQQSNGNTLKIDNIKIVRHEEKVKVYNFTVAEFHTYFVSDLGIWVHNIGPCDVIPNQGKVSVVNRAPSVDAGKQGKHIQGHNNFDSNKTAWPKGQNGVELTQKAWLKGTRTSKTGNVRVWDTGKPIGPNGETGIRVHIDSKGNIHGYPVDPSIYLP